VLYGQHRSFLDELPQVNKCVDELLIEIRQRITTVVGL